jgi:hypothetical protein
MSVFTDFLTLVSEISYSFIYVHLYSVNVGFHMASETKATNFLDLSHIYMMWRVCEPLPWC